MSRRFDLLRARFRHLRHLNRAEISCFYCRLRYVLSGQSETDPVMCGDKLPPPL